MNGGRLIQNGKSASAQPLLAMFNASQLEWVAQKAEGLIVKIVKAAALLLSRRTGKQRDVTVTIAAWKGTWFRLYPSPVEGRLERSFINFVRD